MSKRYGYNEFTGTDIVSSDTMLGQVEALGFSCLSTQGANPSPSSPQTIYSTGDSGAIGMWSHKKNICFTNISEWESGNYNNETGVKEDSVSRVRLKELLKVTPNTTYYVNLHPTTSSYKFVLRAYNKNKVFAGSIGVVENGAAVTTASTNEYISITIYNSAGITTDFNAYTILFNNGNLKPFICLNSETNKLYEPYQGNTPSIPLPVGYIGGSLPNLVADTKAQKKIGKVVLNGSESWQSWTTGTNTIGFRLLSVTNLKSIVNSSTAAIVISSHFVKSASQNALTSSDTEGFATTVSNLYFRINKTRLSTVDVAGFKTWLASNNVTVYYELATPVDVSITIPQILTYEGQNTITSTNSVKPTLVTDVWSR